MQQCFLNIQSTEKEINMPTKNIIVSGAAGNLGKAVVSQFLQQGWKVVGLVHHRSTTQEMHPKDYQEWEVDLLNANATTQTVQAIISQLGTIDAAVLTAGGFTMGTIATTSLLDIQQQLQLNFETAYNVAKPVFAQMQLQQSGTLFFIGSLAGMNTQNGNGVTAYSLSKSLLFQLANIIQAEAAGSAIKAHVVVPSIIDTPQNRAVMPDADFSQWETPLQIATVIAQYANGNCTDTNSIIIIRDRLLRQ